MDVSEELKPQECMFHEDKGTLIIHHQPTGRDVAVIRMVKNSNRLILEAIYMPKKGYTQIIVSNEVREILQKTARESGFRTVNEMLKHLIETAIFSRVNPGVNPRSTLTHYNTIKLSPIPPLNPVCFS